MALVQFQRHSAVNFGSGPVRLVKGETMEVSDEYATRWTAKGLAKVVTGKPAAKPTDQEPSAS